MKFTWFFSFASSFSLFEMRAIHTLTHTPTGDRHPTVGMAAEVLFRIEMWLRTISAFSGFEFFSQRFFFIAETKWMSSRRFLCRSSMPKRNYGEFYWTLNGVGYGEGVKWWLRWPSPKSTLKILDFDSNAFEFLRVSSNTSKSFQPTLSRLFTHATITFRTNTRQHVARRNQYQLRKRMPRTIQ